MNHLRLGGVEVEAEVDGEIVQRDRETGDEQRQTVQHHLRRGMLLAGIIVLNPDIRNDINNFSLCLPQSCIVLLVVIRLICV